MKKTWLLMAFAAILAFPARAAEPVSPAAEKRVLPWQTMRGYKAFYEAGYVFTLDDNDCFLAESCVPPDCNRLSLTTSQGYQFNNFFYLGAGAGMEVNTYRKSKGEEAGVSVPIFADLRFNILNDKKVLPFVVVRAGGCVGYWRGAYFNVQAGIRVKLDKKSHALYAALVFDGLVDDDVIDGSSGLGFRIGFEY